MYDKTGDLSTLKCIFSDIKLLIIKFAELCYTIIMSQRTIDIAATEIIINLKMLIAMMENLYCFFFVSYYHFHFYAPILSFINSITSSVI